MFGNFAATHKRRHPQEMSSPVVRHRVEALVGRIRNSPVPSNVRYVPLRQLPLIFPNMTDDQLAEVAAFIISKTRDKLDSLSEMGEMESLRLQMAMDRKSNMMATLSNLLKKMSDTSSSITQNIK